jgi:hypothetical protein
MLATEGTRLMPKFEVTVERSAYQVATVIIEAHTAEQAAQWAQQILNGPDRFGSSQITLKHLEFYPDDESSWEINETCEA